MEDPLYEPVVSEQFMEIDIQKSLKKDIGKGKSVKK